MTTNTDADSAAVVLAGKTTPETKPSATKPSSESPFMALVDAAASLLHKEDDKPLAKNESKALMVPVEADNRDGARPEQVPPLLGTDYGESGTKGTPTTPKAGTRPDGNGTSIVSPSPSQEAVAAKLATTTTSSNYIAGTKADLYDANAKKLSFAESLYEILSSGEHVDVLQWMPNGRAFTIVDHKKFTLERMPKLFNIRNMSSFVRKLCRWGFSRVHEKETRNSDIFQHEHFRRGELELCRRKVKCIGRLIGQTVVSGVASPPAAHYISPGDGLHGTSGRPVVFQSDQPAMPTLPLYARAVSVDHGLSLSHRSSQSSRYGSGMSRSASSAYHDATPEDRQYRLAQTHALIARRARENVVDPQVLYRQVEFEKQLALERREIERQLRGRRITEREMAESRRSMEHLSYDGSSPAMLRGFMSRGLDSSSHSMDRSSGQDERLHGRDSYPSSHAMRLTRDAAIRALLREENMIKQTAIRMQSSNSRSSFYA